MNKYLSAILLSALTAAAGAQEDSEFSAGQPLGATNQEGTRVPISDNVDVVGSFRFAESCTFDPQRNLILAMNTGVQQNVQANDGYVSLVHPDGFVHTPKWIGETREGLTLNDPLGSTIAGGVLYAADIDTVRSFDLETGQPLDSFQLEGATVLNGITATGDGVVYVTNTRPPERVYRLNTTSGDSTVLIEGAPLNGPNGITIDNDGNLVVVNVGNNEVQTFSRDGELIRTEHTVDPGNDGIVITGDGTKYVSSVRYGTISRIRPGGEAEVIAEGIPSPASICHDTNQNQLVVPMNNNNALGFVPLEE